MQTILTLTPFYVGYYIQYALVLTATSAKYVNDYILIFTIGFPLCKGKSFVESLNRKRIIGGEKNLLYKSNAA